MGSDDWNYGHYSGSGHAQSMLLHGRPALARTPQPKALQALGPWKDGAFPGELSLWWYPEPAYTLELRWRTSKRSVRLPWGAVRRITRRLANDAVDFELEQLNEKYNDDEFDRLAEAGHPDLALVNEPVPLGALRKWANEVAARGRSGGIIEELGQWQLTLVDEAPTVAWRETGQRRERRIPLVVILWADEHVTRFIEQEREREGGG